MSWACVRGVVSAVPGFCGFVEVLGLDSEHFDGFEEGALTVEFELGSVGRDYQVFCSSLPVDRLARDIK